MAKDMTSGSPLKLLLWFTVPLLIGNVFQLLYSMVDTVIVGRYVSPQALAAVGSTGSLSFFVIGFAGGLMAGFSIVVSQNYGALQRSGTQDYSEIRHSVAVSFLLTAVIAVVITAAMAFFTRPLLNMMQTPSDIVDDAELYISIIFYGTVTTLFYNLASSIMRAVGDSKTPLYFLIFSSLVNIGLDLLFVLAFDLEVAGVAYATIASQAVSCILSIGYLFSKYKFLRPHKEDWRMDLATCGKLLRLGVPNAFMNSITAIGCMVVQSVVNSFGSTVVAAYTAASKVEQIATQPGASFGTAMATYAGQNSGAHRLDRVRTGVRKGALLTFFFNIAAGILVIFFGKYLTILFLDTDDAAMMSQILSAAQTYQFAIACCFWALGLLFLYRNALQGLGKPIIPFWSGVLELIARTGISIWFANLFGFAGMCWASPAAWLAAMVILVWGFYYHIRRLDPHAKKQPKTQKNLTA